MRSLFLLAISWTVTGAFAETQGPFSPAENFRLTASWADLPAGEVSVVSRPQGNTVRVNSLQSAIDYPCLVRHGASLEVQLSPPAPRSSFSAFKLPIPAKGEDFALILGNSPARLTVGWLVPSGLDELPPGATFLINRSARKIRVSLEGQILELEAGASRRHPMVASRRIVAQLKIEALEGPQWTMARSNRMVVSPGQRVVMLVGPGQHNPEPYHIATVIDADSGSYQKTLPLTATPPPPDQPAK
jgi:hypothetical protein